MKNGKLAIASSLAAMRLKIPTVCEEATAVATNHSTTYYQSRAPEASKKND